MSERNGVIALAIAGIIIPLVFFLLYQNEFSVLRKDSWFVVLLVIGLFAQFAFAIIMLNKLADPNFDKFRIFYSIAFVFVTIWIGAWCSDYRSKVEQGIEYKYDK